MLVNKITMKKIEKTLKKEKLNKFIKNFIYIFIFF